MDEVLIPVLGILGAVVLPIAAVAWVVYWMVIGRHRERMAMIERGLSPDEGGSNQRPSRYGSLRTGLLMAGLAIGTVAGIFLARLMAEDYEKFLLIVSLIAICGGGALVSYFFISKKLMDKEAEDASLAER